MKTSCVACGSKDSNIWWKCCPDHTPERSSAVVCTNCYKQLHPYSSSKEIDKKVTKPSVELKYDRVALIQTLIYHQQTPTSGCHCGWGELGKSYCEHVANIYEMVLKEKSM